MSQKDSTRQVVAEILTDLFGNRSEGVIFHSKNTTKRSGGKKLTKYDLKTSTNWSAKYDGSVPIWVSSVGMTMTEFIREYKHKNIYFLTSKQHGFPEITIYLNQPEWKTSGCVKKVNLEKGELTIYLVDLLHVEEIVAKITKETPKWLLNSSPQFASFTCKIYQGWRSLKSFEEFDWDKVWKTFKLDSYLSKEEMEDFL